MHGGRDAEHRGAAREQQRECGRDAQHRGASGRRGDSQRPEARGDGRSAGRDEHLRHRGGERVERERVTDERGEGVDAARGAGGAEPVHRGRLQPGGDDRSEHCAVGGGIREDACGGGVGDDVRAADAREVPGSDAVRAYSGGGGEQ